MDFRKSARPGNSGDHLAGQYPQPRGDGAARHAISRRPRLRSPKAGRGRSLAAARHLFANALDLENRMIASSSPRRWLFVLTILVGSFLLFLVQPMVARMLLHNLGASPRVSHRPLPL